MASSAPMRQRQLSASAAATTALLLFAAPATVGAAAGVDARRAQPTQLRPAGGSLASQADYATMHRVAASLGFARVPEDGDTTEEDTKHENQLPVSMQVPEKEIEALAAKLTPGCGAQFDDILHGRSMLHTFGDSGRTSQGECAKLHGSLCELSARLTQAQAIPGRSIESTTHVSGDSCLPNSCMSDGDLQVLAEFFKLKAQDSLPGANVDIRMSVDCTRSGGGSVGRPATPGADALSPATWTGGSSATGSLGHRSAAAAVHARGFLALLATFIAVGVVAAA